MTTAAQHIVDIAERLEIKAAELRNEAADLRAIAAKMPQQHARHSAAPHPTDEERN